jgi:hypothetical protein
MPGGDNTLFTGDCIAIGGIDLNWPIAGVLAGDSVFQLELLECDNLLTTPKKIDVNIIYQPRIYYNNHHEKHQQQ